MKRHNMADSDIVGLDAAPAGVLNDNPVMEAFSISVNGILKLLQNLKPGKAARPNRIKPLLLKAERGNCTNYPNNICAIN